ncbi:MAG: hypothetical protein ACYCVA_06905, partial [Sulfobacillus sp.]
PQPMKGRATLVAIDGMGGAGKTTLADAVLAHGPAPIALVHGVISTGQSSLTGPLGHLPKVTSATLITSG